MLCATYAGTLAEKQKKIQFRRKKENCSAYRGVIQFSKQNSTLGPVPVAALSRETDKPRPTYCFSKLVPSWGAVCRFQGSGVWNRECMLWH